MPLFDKVKAQAAELAQRAHEAGKAGQAKLDDVQARRRADGLLRDLGAAIFAQRSGRASESTAADIERLVGELSSFEAAHGPLAAAGAGDSDGQDAPNDSEPLPGGGFTLEP